MNVEPSRRRFRFSLRMFFVALTVLAIWLGWTVYEIRNRKAVERFLVTHYRAGVTYGPPLRPWKQLPLRWRLLGVDPIQRIDAQGIESQEDREHILEAFPEADIHF